MSLLNKKGVLSLVMIACLLGGEGTAIYAGEVQENEVVIEEVSQEVNIDEALVRINEAQAEIEDYEAVGIVLEPVAVENIGVINKAVGTYRVRKGDYLQVEEIKEVVTNKTYVLNKLLEAVDCYEVGVSCYEDLDIIGVNDDNLQLVNQQVRGKGYTSIYKIQLEVDEINRILDKINRGEAEAEEYEKIGVKVEGIAAENIDFINKRVSDKHMGVGQMLSARQIRDIVYEETQELERIFRHINEDCYMIHDLENIGITGVNNENYEAINRKVVGKGYTSIDKLQSIVDEVNNSELEDINKKPETISRALEM